MHRATLAFALFVTTFSASGIAVAQETPPQDPSARSAQLQKLSEEGAAFYQQRDYRRANAKFQQAYAIDPDPNLLYNIAKCYEALGEKQVAIEKFELFINSPGADSAARQRAQQAVRILRGGDVPAGAAPSQPASEGTTPAAHPDQHADQEPPAHSHANVPAIVSFAVGGAGLVVGSVFGVLSLGKRSDLDAVCPNRVCLNSSAGDISSLKTMSGVSTIGFIVGAAGVVAGGVFLLTGGASRSAEASTTGSLKASPYIGLGSAGVAGSF